MAPDGRLGTFAGLEGQRRLFPNKARLLLTTTTDVDSETTKPQPPGGCRLSRFSSVGARPLDVGLLCYSPKSPENPESVCVGISARDFDEISRHVEALSREWESKKPTSEVGIP